MITWNYSVADSDVEYLAKDQTKVETFTITLDDGNGGTVDRTVSVTITGTNDAPVVAATDVTGAVTEQVTPLGNLTDTGTIAFTDVDLTDAHTISPTITASAGALGALTASVTSDTTGSGLGGVITWNYSVADSDVEYLAKDQTKVETFTITLDDGNGGTVDRTVSVTITGTNDAPVVAATDVTGAVTEQVTPLGNLTDTGTIAFTDVDLTDAHTISPTITASAGALGALTASVTSDTTGSGLGGVITWNYSVADSDVEYLAKDQTKVETFTITLDDGNGGTVDRTVSVTITGTNDAPVVAATDVTGAVTEQVTPLGNLTDTGTIAFTDVDLTDAHTISPTITASAGALGALTASVTSDTTGSGLGGVITWNYSVADSDVEYLAKDQTKVETFTITLDDGNGGTVDRTVSVTITGTNDAPVVAATDVTGAVTEQVTPLGNLTDTGTIAFTDVDLTDAHTISPTITASAGALGALTASVTSDTTGSGLGGVITWNYSVADSDVEYLAKDQTKVETFTITLDDGNGGTVDRTVSVTITGTNDAPVVAATDVTGAVTEQVTPLGNLTDTGTIAFTDVDLTDAHTISPTITASAGALGALTASVTSDTTGSGLGGVITWNYSVADSDVEYLAKDQTKVETFTITLDDGNGGTVDRTVSVTITGTNDAPVVAATDVTGAVTEQVTPLGNLTDTGTIAFTDVDLTDAHTISPTITASAGALGALTASVTSDTTGSGLGGVITWNYSVADSDVEYLAKDQTKVETFTITLDDGNGGTVDRTVSVTITGTNDAPVVAATDVTGAVTEQVTPLGNLTDTGTIAFTDVDLTDAHTISPTITASAGALGALTASVTSDTTGSGLGGVITWNYSVADSDVEYLAKDQTKVETFTITLDDGNGGTVDRTVSVTITGTNDAPVVAATDVTGAVTEQVTPLGNLTDTGTIAFTDVDLTDAHTISPTITASAGALGALTASVTSDTTGSGLGGVITWNYSVADSDVEYLAKDQTKVETFTITLDDGNGGTVDRTVSVTITGTNDAPVVAATDVTGAVTEQVTPLGNLTDTGTIAFTDVDLTDAHTISPTITASAGALGALTASVTSDTTGSGLGGVITWNYSVADSDVEYLAKDQTKVETFTITLDDGNGGTVDRTVSVTITGTNDAPVVAATDVTGAVTEQVTPLGNLTDTGTIAFTDVDLTDAHTISPTITASAGALGALTASVTSDTTGSGLGGVITWNYSVADSDVEYLAKDQTKVETFTITLDDGNGGTVDRTVSVTITGTNDAPVVAATDVTGAVTEQVTPLGNLTDTGTIAFTDVDLTDAHTISPTITASAGALGALTASVTSDTTGSGLGGVITWNYSVADSDVEYLAKDQTKVETFTITLDDGNGGTVDRTVSVTITGTNDAPVVAATDVTGAVTEQVTPLGNLTDTGTIAFTDVDLTDAHTISPTITASAGALGALTASVTSDTTGSGLGGVITWNYSVADSDVEYLAKDQTKVETFTITLDDGNGGTVDRTVSVTITGTNDAPVVAATDVTGAVTEQVTPLGNLTDTGTIAFTDVDLTDAHTISPTITASAGALGALTASVTSDTTGSGLGGVITWNYSVADSDVEYLAKDQTKVETFTITLDDGNGGTVDRTVSVTITGTNDAPVVAATDVTGAVTEQVTPLGNLTDTGTIAFTDVDLTDAHTISPTITASAGALGALTASVTSDTTGSGLGGVITWNYSVADSDVEYLAKDQTKVETFTITLDDGNGGTVDRTVSVTITGTNDAPVVAATDVTGAVTEQVTPLGNLTDTGTIAFTDVDLTDAHTISPTITASAGALGALTASVTSDTTGSGLGGVITWNYSVADSDVEYLAKDQTKVETFTITLDDGNGGTVDRTVSVTITGTNDAPVVAATDVTGAVTEQVTPLGNLTDTGTIAFTDVDLTDAHTISPTITASAGALGALTASVTSDTTGSGLGGVITWNYSVADSDVEYLAKDQTKVETFTITLDDGNGGTVDRTVSVTITGTNDAPVVAATDVTGAVTEQVTPLGNLTDTGTIAFTDVDLTDAHTISPTITASAGALGALTASVTSDTTGSGLGGVITWNYSVADSDVEYLAKDQTKVETFTITLDDGNGGTVDRTVSVTITGTNDAPVVAATDVTGAVTEQVTPLGNLTDTGTIAFTDVDLTDAHTISPTITASAGALGALTASVTSDTTGSGLGGVITWNYSVADSDVEYLAKDQTKVETFTITLDDGNGGTVDRTVSVTITGTNDAPVVAATDVTGAVTEQVTPLGNLTDTGTIAFTDVDLTDAHTISPTITASAGALGALTASVTSDTTGSGLGGVITWNYSVADSDVEYLAKDQTKVETFTITLDDGNGGTVDRTVSVTITGTNDAPVVAATDVTGAVTEQVTPLGNLTDTGTIAFTDVDLTDAHTISPTITASAGALGALTASVTSDTTGSGLGGVITWNYSVADSDVEYLAKDQTKVETFTITLDDGNGGTVDRTVSVTITGTNDAPVVAATDVTGAVTEQVTPLGNLTDTGTIAFTDVDLTDAHTISPTITASAGALGALTASVTSDTTGSGLGGVITWNYSVADSDVEYLAKDQTKVETFTITLDDGNGGTVDRTVSVTITGTNDAPVVAATDVTGAVTEQVTPLGNLTDTGTIAFTDVDLTDAHTISPTITASAGALGALTASVTSDTTGSGLGGVITWNYSVADSDVEYLAKDQTKVETFTITLDDGNGGTVDRTVSVTITGTNDAPVVAATDVTGAVTEQVTPLGNLTDTGTIAFTDVDLTDAHTISPTITASAGALGALTASVTSDTTGSGLGGVITWNYSVADSDVEYLAKDQTKVETFTITLDDGNGGTVDRTVSVTITGTNDAPVVAATDVTGAVTEQVTPLGNLTDTGTIAFTDVDLTDAHTISPTITASAGALGALTASVTSDTTGSGLGGVITWNYSVADSDVEYLAKDQTKVETFTITLDDGNGGTVDRTVSVTITGTNDAPVVAATDVTGAVTEQVTPLGNLTDTGTIAFTDVDLTDAHTISPTITASAGALGALTASVTSDTTGSGLGGVITWNYSVADSDVEYLAKDQTKVETFTITLDDGNGGTVDRTVSVTITGTNDAPVVAATDVTGAVTEQVTPLGNLTDTGTIAFTDVDLTDAHTISPTITASAGALGALTASVTSDTTGSGLGGVITWNYSVADSDVEYLAKDQTKVETFTITLDDGNGGTVDRTVSVTITGTNDAPVVAATDVTGAVTEQVTPLGNLTDTGTIAFTDVDLTDAHTISPTITASAGALGALTASVTSDTTGSGLGGVITWNYSVADSDVEYLAKDQTKVETFTITLDDGNGGTVDRTVSVTITGTNDAPVVAATDVTGAVTEQVTPLGNLTDTGTIAFTDVDLTDAHTISPTITASAGALGALTASVTSDTTGSGLGGVITWNYSVADSDVEYLAKDQTKVETFTITLDDGNGGTVDRTVSVTITGTNDAPVVAATDVTGAVTEQVTPLGNLTDTGTIAFTDVDLTDAHTISPTITASAGALGALTASVTSDTTGSGLGGVITWNYSVADSDVEYLAKDQTKVETFTITLDDGNGGTVDRTVSVTITGTNDAPVVAATDVTGAVTEQVTPLGQPHRHRHHCLHRRRPHRRPHHQPNDHGLGRRARRPHRQRHLRHHRLRPGWRDHLELQRRR
ncbi:VCBS domain-containing protein [Mesorhizobium sp. ISC11]|uniref:VCBS domain-containing protein n=1 Tax=Mesorhizobium sp. ISC11 TaxID=3076428 RepID=UPI00301E2C30